MKATWDITKCEFVDTPKEMLDFFKDIRKVYENHNLCISHEDRYGCFIIERYNNDWEENMVWLTWANKGY